MKIQVTSIKKEGKTYAITIQYGLRERIIRNIEAYDGLRVGKMLKEGQVIAVVPPDGEELEVEDRFVPLN